MLRKSAISLMFIVGALGVLATFSSGFQSCANAEVKKHEDAASEAKGRADALAKTAQQAANDAANAKDEALRHEANANRLQGEVADLKRRLADARRMPPGSGPSHAPDVPDLGVPDGSRGGPASGGMDLAEKGKLLNEISILEATVAKQDAVIVEKDAAIVGFKDSNAKLEKSNKDWEATWKAERDRASELRLALQNQKAASVAASWNGGWKGALVGAAVALVVKR